MSLFLDIDLPAGALLPPRRSESAPLGIHLIAGADWMTLERDVVTGWRAATGDTRARPARPNTENARLVSHAGHDALALSGEENRGFAIEGVSLDSPLFSMAVLFAAPSGRAGTLCTLNPDDGQNYLFLAEADGTLRLEFRDDDTRLTAPLNQGYAWHLAVASASGKSLRLSVDDGPPSLAEAGCGLASGAHTLFIGCRSDRAGILKTLGDARLAELWILPGVDLFDAAHADDLAALKARAAEVNRHAV